MRSLLPDVREQFREKSHTHRVRTFVVPIICFAHFIRKPRPMRNAGRQFVRKIHKLFCGQHFLDRPKRCLALSSFASVKPTAAASTIVRNAKRVGICISALLKNARAKSQQLRITPNKLRLFATIWVCVRLLEVLSTPFCNGARVGKCGGYSR